LHSAAAGGAADILQLAILVPIECLAYALRAADIVLVLSVKQLEIVSMLRTRIYGTSSMLPSDSSWEGQFDWHRVFKTVELELRSELPHLGTVATDSTLCTKIYLRHNIFYGAKMTGRIDVASTASQAVITNDTVLFVHDATDQRLRPKNFCSLNNCLLSKETSSIVMYTGRENL
jgi:hypothetical protein